ncbi:ATP-binding protein [Kutzneria viridogrisea]|uniref:histidine kinase n=1 Tax=Kutzneria viridogrisea TaxID=47990 RepID=A0ABR6BNM1_9PSEU|nr:signal transduction histidine kinase [Kutzneria viridogrisea]
MTRGWSLRRWYLVVVGVMVAAVLGAVVVGALALNRLGEARALVVDQLDPASRQALVLSNALVNEETGIRGYVLARDQDFLQPYLDGKRQEAAAADSLRTLFVGELAGSATGLAEIEDSAQAWRSQYAQPVVEGTGSGAPELGKALFDQVRAKLAMQEADLAGARTSARAELATAGDQIVTVGLVLAGVLIALVVLLAVLSHLGVIRPVSRLVTEVRQVADGRFKHQVLGSGPREIVRLASDVDAMRLRILDELDAYQQLHQELTRSNSELEQFAYVASHDLQEPLRKVASFCQLLERRYKGQLDERADQYIGFAVDGAKRMQGLINDLLAFSRVGRVTREQVVIEAEAVLAAAKANLETAIEESGAEITAGPLPRVRGEVSLLTAVFQNLIGNAIKFRGQDPPRVSLTAERTGEFWTFTCADSGMGIEAEYAERIFVIFQRLHPKDAYPGTGIGLAMCRKIVEYHGGRIWLDATEGPGSTFRFTLPAIEENSEPEA